MGHTLTSRRFLVVGTEHPYIVLKQGARGLEHINDNTKPFSDTHQQF